MAKPTSAPQKPGQRPSQGKSNIAPRSQQTQQRPSPSREVATRPGAVSTKGDQVPAYLKGVEGGGRGLSQRQEDNLVPIITILQKNSPQCEKRDPKYLEGAEAGMIWMRGAEFPLVDGDEGFLFQPCYFDQDYVEWVSRSNGGGFVGRHRVMPAEAKQVEVPGDDGKPRKKWVMPNGNEIMETRYHVGRVFLDNGDRLAYVIPLQSTGNTVSKQWMFEMNNKKHPSTGERVDSFAKLYRLRTKYRQNAAGNWFGFEPTDEGWVADQEDYEAGLALFQAFDKGDQRMDEGQFADGAEGGSNGNNDGSM